MKRVVSKMEIDNPKTGGILIHPSLDVSHLVEDNCIGLQLLAR